MFVFEEIENGSERWNEIVKNSSVYDFHHTAYFHKIDTKFDTKLLHFYTEESFIALPIVIRPIERTKFFDITSVYGYVGPISSFKDDNAKQALIQFFQATFIDYCKARRIIAAFSRLHPLIDQHDILAHLGEVIDLNKTVTINLELTPEEQRKAYRKSIKSEINQLKRKEILVKESGDVSEIDQFVAIYYETMDRVCADPMYYFSKEYFYEFLNNPEFEAKLFLAVQNEAVIAGAIFTITDKIMQYHLAGTTEQFIQLTPMKLILDEARLVGNQLSVQNLHLGGGVGGRDDDSLFLFKSGFSKDFKQFSVWKYIVDQAVYDQLSMGRPKSNFFPLYRS